MKSRQSKTGRLSRKLESSTELWRKLTAEKRTVRVLVELELPEGISSSEMVWEVLGAVRYAIGVLAVARVYTGRAKVNVKKP